MRMIDAAMQYALGGFVVFPCKAKKPLTPNGFKDASLEAGQISEWWTRWPDAQVGIPTGAVTGLFVLDVDGPEAAAAVEKMNLPGTREIETRPGRRQLWFTQPAGVTTRSTASVMAKKLDTRGDGGYVIAPPSIHHETGKPYTIVRDVLSAPIPPALLALVTARNGASSTPRTDAPKNEAQFSRHQIRRLYKEALEKLRNAPEGRGNIELNNAALIAARVFASGVMDKTAEQFKRELLDIVTKEWTQPHAERAAQSTIESGWRKGTEEGSFKPGVDPLAWRAMFHTFADFENAPPLSFAIRDFLQVDAATVIGGLSEHGKTWLQISLTKALLKGQGSKLWDYFEVLETANRVVYLIPESAIGPFGHRLKLFGLWDYLRDDRLLVRTLSLGAKPHLDDPRILTAAEGAFVFLDTLTRFTEGEENSAAEFQALADDCFGLLRAKARAVIAAHHSPKGFARENSMTLENMLRGTGDIGAVFATGWGIRQIDPEKNIIHIENIKARDFDRPRPFQLIGRPYINDSGDFAMYKRPGECGRFADEQEPDRDKGGAPQQAREARAANIELLRRFEAENPKATSEELAARFRELGIELSAVTIRKYRREVPK